MNFLTSVANMQSAIHQSGAHGGHGAGDHGHGHSPYTHGQGRGKPVSGSKGGTTNPFPQNPATATSLSAGGGSTGGGSSVNIPVAVSKRGLPKSTGMLTGDAK